MPWHWRALLMVLALALPVGQSLAQIHAALHGVPAAGGHAHAHAAHKHADHDPTDALHTPAAPVPEFEALFGAHSEASDCRLYDQSSGTDGLWHATAPYQVQPLSTQTVFAHQGVLVVRWLVLFDARGPPFLA